MHNHVHHRDTTIYDDDVIVIIHCVTSKIRIRLYILQFLFISSSTIVDFFSFSFCLFLLYYIILYNAIAQSTLLFFVCSIPAVCLKLIRVNFPKNYDILEPGIISRCPLEVGGCSLFVYE